MLVRTKPRWWIAESAATPESVFLDRRRIVQAFGLGLAGMGIGGDAAAAEGVARNAAYTLGDRALTDERYASSYNNFYEFSTSKTVTPMSDALKPRPWRIRIDGLVEKPFEIDIDDLIAKMALEERLYRFRCVEAWAMAVPWTGFPLRRLVDFAKPAAGAKYVVMRTFLDKSVAPGQKQFWYPWPYTEGVTLEEARNDLAFMVTGIYGKTLPNQHGAPLRLALPWKYGFKSVKSINRITFSAERPRTFWEALQDSEYGFWANVNPKVPHPRWSQAEERVLGTGDRVPTLLFNGYAPEVADLYKDLQKERLWA
ncbi:protein-methionine-sulfoxide reductase catalytic subunit MsrP [Enterovirga sp.]|uniref:protein-methionine-sulfoxide reductase catalytic subunit MsrP n=1 Tax=Enterovirga sp. TaxID=2026350 RepID=UPI002B797CC3|nr:protein-methionine-sulfoxide reductase catalytic subunit MsrP [Enterovirga sp.]HMO28313.1 protein-methionine-sulfoxide reductase catalytic subunit MsrP [Enterovirga sp.]